MKTTRPIRAGKAFVRLSWYRTVQYYIYRLFGRRF